jgi:hypothetical protein
VSGRNEKAIVTNAFILYANTNHSLCSPCMKNYFENGFTLSSNIYSNSIEWTMLCMHLHLRSLE